MLITTISSQEFKKDTAWAKRAARRGPVFITDRGRPTHVLLTVKNYRKLADKRGNILDLLAMPKAAEVKFEAPRLGGELYRTANF